MALTVVAVVGGARGNALAPLLGLPVLVAGRLRGTTAALTTAAVGTFTMGAWTRVVEHEPRPLASLGTLVSLVVVALVGTPLVRSARRPAQQADDVLDELVADTAIRLGRVTAHFQPIVDLSTGRVVGAEALSRWSGPLAARIGTERLVAAAERTGSVRRLGRAVLAQAAAQVAAWAAAGRDDLVVNVNVSPVQLVHPSFVDDVAHALAVSGAPPHALCLEITENAVVTQPDTAREVLARLKRLGVSLALDDFGTGMCSLTYLAEFPVDYLKVDASFVARLGDDPTSAAIIESVAALGHALGLVIIAEGIERADQTPALRDLGCDLGQGYALGRPTPAHDVDLLARTGAPVVPGPAPGPLAGGEAA